MKNNVLIIFTKSPDDLRSKTRLRKKISNKEVDDLTESFIRVLKKNLNSNNFDTVWALAEETTHPIFGDCSLIYQSGNSLGERLKNIWDRYRPNYQKIMIIGSDAPQVSLELIQSCFEELDNSESVFGPAEDGGFYLFGTTNGFDSEIFLQVRYSEFDTGAQLKSFLNEPKILDELFDIDEVEDLSKLLDFYKRKKRLSIEEEMYQQLYSIIDSLER